MSSLIRVLFFLFLFFFLFIIPAYAVSVSIDNVPKTIGTDPFTLLLTVSGASAGTNYLRVDIYQNGTISYFGETYNDKNNEWHNGSDGTKYSEITIGSDGTGNGKVQARIGDTILNDYSGSGAYFLRIRRYTAGGNYNNDEAKASAIPVTLIYPTFTPTSTPTPLPEATAKPTKTPKPTNTPTPEKKTQSVDQTDYESVLSESSSGEDVSLSIYPSSVSGSNSAGPTAILAAQITPAKKNTTEASIMREKKELSNSDLLLIVVSMGGVLFIACGILMYVRKIKRKN